MKNLHDLLPEVQRIRDVFEQKRDDAINEAVEALFPLYDEAPEIQKIRTDAENLEHGEYFFDGLGDLCYRVPIPKEVRTLPFIKEYLTQDFGVIDDDHLSQGCGDHISINWYAGDRAYFAYDSSTGHAVPGLEERPKDKEGCPIVPKDYVKAKIEMTMRGKGIFGDVVEVDYYGGYMRHYDLSWPQKGENLDAMTEEELTNIINTYENFEEN